MILRQLERVGHSERIDHVVVATSVDPTDDGLVAMLQDNGVAVRRGPLDDVLSRFISVVDEFSPTTVIRLTGDNPLVDPSVIDAMVIAHEEADVDCTSNSVRRTYPYGLDVECVGANALRRLDSLTLTPREREHVTLGIYSRSKKFSIQQITQSPDHSNLRWTVDYPEDFEFVEEIYSNLYRPGAVFGQDEILKLIERRPDLERTRSDARDG